MPTGTTQTAATRPASPGADAGTATAVSRRSGLMRALAAPLLVAVVVQNIGNLLLHALLGRYLTADQYGALGTVLSLMVLLTVPLGALQVAASKAATAGPSDRVTQRASVRALLGIGLGASLAVMAAAPLAASAFRLPTIVDALVLGPFVGVSLALAIVRGRLLGLDERRGVRSVAVTFVLSTVARLTLTVAAMNAWGTTGALLATLAGEALALAYGLHALRRSTRGSDRPVGPHPWLRLREVGGSGLAIGGLFLFTTIDLFLARYFLDGPSSGGYVAAATIGKTLLALPAAALAAGYPRLVKAGRGPQRRPELRRTGLVVVGLAVLAGLVVAAVPGLVLDGLYGDAFDGQADLVRVLAIVAALSSVVSVATYALLAVGSRLSLLPWAGAAVQLVAIAVWHESALQVATASAIALALTLLASIVALRWDLGTRARHERTA